MSFDPKRLLPKAGTRFVLPALHGAADAYVLAEAARAIKANNNMLVVVVANAIDAQRLLIEMQWFGSGDEQALRCHLLPDW